MTDSLVFPGPKTADPEDVAWNLQTGATMWGRGDQHEAVRWIRRAAEAASDAGADDRALELARAAADLTNALALPPSIIPPPVATPAPAAVSPPVSTPAPVTPHPLPPPVSPLSPDEATVPRSVPAARIKPPPARVDDPTMLDHTIPAGVEAAERQRPPPSRRPPPPSRSSPSAAPPPVSSPMAAPTRSSPSAAPPPPRSAPARSSPSAAPPPRSAPTRSSPSAAPSGGPRARQALRVAVTHSGDDKNVMIVRALADDEPVPFDAHEALLVALDAGVHLTGKKR